MSSYDGVFVPKGTRERKWEAAYDLLRTIITQDPVVADWLPDSGDWFDPGELAGGILRALGDQEILAMAWSQARIVVVSVGSHGAFAHHVPRPVLRTWREPVDPETYVADLLRMQPARPTNGIGAARRRRRSPARSARRTGAKRAIGDRSELVDFAGLRCRRDVRGKLRRLFGARHAAHAARTIARDFTLTFQGPLPHPLQGVHKTKRREVSWFGRGSAVIVTVARNGVARYSVEWLGGRRAYVNAIWRGAAEERPGPAETPQPPRETPC